MDLTVAQWKSKNIIISLVVVIVGLGLMVLGAFNTGTIYSIASQIGSILTITMAWNIIYEMTLRSNFIDIIKERTDKILEKIDLAKQEEEFGLVEIYPRSDGYNFQNFLTTNKNVTILLNDGRTWISNHSPKIEDRLKNNNFKTTFIVTHPDSDMVKVLATKQEMTDEGIKRKIYEFIKSVKSIQGYNQERIKILGHKLYNPHSIFLGDNRLITTSYHVSRGRRHVPLYIFEDGGENSYFQSVKLDMEYLVKDSDDIADLPSQK